MENIKDIANELFLSSMGLFKGFTPYLICILNYISTLLYFILEPDLSLTDTTLANHGMPFMISFPRGRCDWPGIAKQCYPCFVHTSFSTEATSSESEDLRWQILET